MYELNRREFMITGGKLAALMGLSAAQAPQIAQALENLSSGRLPVLWLQGQSCSGCSVSFLNTHDPGPARVLTKYISLLLHPTLSTAAGKTAMDIIDSTVKRGDIYLVVEGSIPADVPHACMMGRREIGELIVQAARNAQAVVALGTCAAYGGIPAAEGNPTGAVSVPEYLSKAGVRTPVVSIPGCPPHPDWLVGTLTHLISYGLPPLDDEGRPKMFFSRLIHDQCPRFADYERENFAKTFADDGCLFKLGCSGPVTHADCTLRQWNGGVNSCIRAGAPCIGCGSRHFVKDKAISIYTKPRNESNTVKS